MRGTLFTQDNLSQSGGRITETAALRDVDASNLAASQDRIAEILQTFPGASVPAEAVTGLDLKRPYFLAERVSG